MPRIAFRAVLLAARSLRLTVLLLLALPAASCLPSLPSGPNIPPTGGRRVLFVGNSLTYTGNLPRVVADLAAAAGEERLVYKMVAHPNFALEDHWYTGIAEEIAKHDWDLVVMQQGPSSLPENAEHLRFWTVKLDSVAKAHGVRSALYQVWPASAYMGSFTAVRESYRNAALAVDGMFIPAGEAWRTAWDTDANLQLYGDDGFHPSGLGIFLTALVMFEMLYDRPATSLPPIARVGGLPLNLSPNRIVQLQSAAHGTVEVWGIR